MTKIKSLCEQAERSRRKNEDGSHMMNDCLWAFGTCIRLSSGRQENHFVDVYSQTLCGAGYKEGLVEVENVLWHTRQRTAIGNASMHVPRLFADQYAGCHELGIRVTSARHF